MRLVIVLAIGACGYAPSRVAPGDGADLADAADDAPLPDGSPVVGAPSFAVAAVASGTTTATLTYALDIPAGTGRFLIVSVQLGTNCFNSVPNITAVRFNNVALTQNASVVGTPCGNGGTRSDQWILVDPAVGLHDISIGLANTAETIHSGAIALTGVDPLAPVRATATNTGTSASSTVTVASAPDDLVVNTVGDGNSVVAPGGGQTQRFLKNVNNLNTLNNSAGSTAPGGANVTMTWSFGAVDEWQTISTSVRGT